MQKLVQNTSPNSFVWQRSLRLFIEITLAGKTSIGEMAIVTQRIMDVIQDPLHEDIRPDMIRVVVTQDWSPALPKPQPPSKRTFKWLHSAFNSGFVGRMVDLVLSSNERPCTRLHAVYALMWFSFDKHPTNKRVPTYYASAMMGNGIIGGSRKIQRESGGNNEVEEFKRWLTRLLHNLSKFPAGKTTIKQESANIIRRDGMSKQIKIVFFFLLPLLTLLVLQTEL